MCQCGWLRPVNSNYSITLNEAIVTMLAEEPGEAFALSRNPDRSIGLAVLEFSELTWLGRKCKFKEFLRKGGAHSKTLGIIGMNPIGQALAQQACLGFGMEILYYDWQPVPEIEAAYGARFISAEDVLRQADLVCVVLPLAGKLARLIKRHYMALKSKQAKSMQTISIAWRRSLPIERAAIHLGRHYSDCVPLDDLAAIAGLSKFRLARLFSTTLGITPHRFQLLLRVFYARSMLHHDVEIGEIAYRLGFSDQSHFGRCFRSITSTTPGQYQRAVLHDNRGASLFYELALETTLENA